MYYDITGPFTPPDANVLPNEKGGFFGGMSLTFSIKQIGQKLAGKEWDWGGLLNWSLRYELEHVSKFGSLHYYGTLPPDAAGNYLAIPTEGRPFFLSQPQLVLDVGKLARVVDGKLYAGLEYQIALNRYLQKGVHENVAQLLFKWNL
jgi:hypothetical protein